MYSTLYIQEQEASEKLQVALNSARLTADQHAKTIDELREQLSTGDGASATRTSMDQKAWKATAISRMSEEKANRIATELDNKVNSMVYSNR